jgi:hypothetical protein
LTLNSGMNWPDLKAPNDRVQNASDHRFDPNARKPSADCASPRSTSLLANGKIDRSNPNIRPPKKIRLDARAAIRHAAQAEAYRRRCPHWPS